MTNSPKRLLSLAISVVALALVVAPVSFAGEDNPGPTQAGETQSAPSGPSSPALSEGPVTKAAPVSTSAPAAKTKNSASGNVLGVSHTASRTVVSSTRTSDTVQAKGGIQAGFGGMATDPTSLPALLAGVTGVLLILGAAFTFIPVRLRSQN
jgi:hypothetical protein